ncbi:carbohydrate ABC transporter permease [Cohnella algarum]|uniref:carbohydrate ABC transporter permease n=1 Tax=Cohnella algarum TaxID=2044859 RepID=UPI001F071C75|nr:sugar ABC transporter permease [Cohnella algarum]
MKSAYSASPPLTAGKVRSKSKLYFWGLVFLLPEIVIFCVFLWKPIVMGIYYSLHDINFVKGNTFVGLQNYIEMIRDDSFFTAIRNTLWFIFLGLAIGYWVPAVAAIAISELRRFKSTARLIVYLPNIVPAVALYGVWKWLFEPIGPLNNFLSVFGLDPVMWLTDKSMSMFSIVLMNTWHHFGATALIYLAAVMSIPKDLYEAAEIDGAGVFQRIRYITLPSIRMIFVLMLIMQLISNSQSYEPQLAMTGADRMRRQRRICCSSSTMPSNRSRSARRRPWASCCSWR